MEGEISSPPGVCLTIPFRSPFPFPFPFPCRIPVISYLSFPPHTVCSLPFPGRFLMALRFLLTIAVIIVNAIARMAPSTAQHSGICLVLIIIILVDYLIPIRWSYGQEVSWLVIPAAWRRHLCPGIITTLPRETFTGAFNLPRAGCLWIDAIELIPEGTGVVPPPIVHLVAGLVKCLPYIWAAGCPTLLKWWTPAAAVRPHPLEVWKVASPDWIKNDYTIKEVPWPHILDTANILYPNESTHVSRNQSHYMVPIQRLALIYNW